MSAFRSPPPILRADRRSLLLLEFGLGQDVAVDLHEHALDESAACIGAASAASENARRDQP